MLILDTNIFSALMRKEPDQKIIDWLDKQSAESIWTTSVTIFEIKYGLGILPQSKKRKDLESAFLTVCEKDLKNRIFDFDPLAANEAARISADLKNMGKPVDFRDVQIAGITAARKGALVTCNTKHFINCGIEIIDPLIA